MRVKAAQPLSRRAGTRGLAFRAAANLGKGAAAAQLPHGALHRGQERRRLDPAAVWVPRRRWHTAW